MKAGCGDASLNGQPSKRISCRLWRKSSPDFVGKNRATVFFIEIAVARQVRILGRLLHLQRLNRHP